MLCASSPDAFSMFAPGERGPIPAYAANSAIRNELWVSQAETGNMVVIFGRMNNAWMQMGELTTGLNANAITFSKDGLPVYLTNQGAVTVSVINVKGRAKLTNIVVGRKPNGIVLTD